MSSLLKVEREKKKNVLPTSLQTHVLTETQRPLEHWPGPQGSSPARHSASELVRDQA